MLILVTCDARACAELSQDHDNLPLNAEKAVWTRRTFFGVLPWWALCLSNWTIGSTLLSLGLTVWQALMCTAIALSITTGLDIIAGHIGARHRITEPIACRLSFGITGSTLLVAVFGIYTLVWYSVQMWFGSQCLRVVIGAIAPQFLTMEDNLGSEALATNDLISILLFWVVLLVLHWWNIDLIRKIAREAALVVFASMLSIVITCLVKAKGVGPLFNRPYEVIGVSEPPRGGELRWTLCLAISIVLSVNCTWFMPSALPCRVTCILNLVSLQILLASLKTRGMRYQRSASQLACVSRRYSLVYCLRQL